MINHIGITSVALTALCLLSGCDKDEKSAFICQTAENSKVDGGTGLRNVLKFSSGSTDTIGYLKNSTVVAHSECSAAVLNTTSSTYSWYEYGQPIEHNKVHSIHFYTNGEGQLSTRTTRLPKEGRWQLQVVENKLVTKQQWSNEQLFDKVVVENNFNSNGIKEVVVSSGKLKKVKRYNNNSAQYDCTYDDHGRVTLDPGCNSESYNDLAIFNVNVNSDFYLKKIENAPITYELSEDNILGDVKRYW